MSTVYNASYGANAPTAEEPITITLSLAEALELLCALEVYAFSDGIAGEISPVAITLTKQLETVTNI